ADPIRLAINLGESDPVFQHVVFEQIGPRSDSRQPAANRQSRFRLAKVSNELEWRQRLAARLDSDRASGGSLLLADLERRFERFSFRSERPHQQLLAGNPIEPEPSRVSPLERRRIPLFPLRIPDDLGGGNALAE